MLHAAHLVLDGEQHRARIEIDDVLEAVLMLIALLGNDAELLQPAVGAGEIRDIDLDMVTVEGRLRLVGLAKDEILPGPDHDAGSASIPVIQEVGRGAHDLAVEAGDPAGGAGPRVEPDIGHPERNEAEALPLRRMTMDAIAPGTGGLDAIIGFAESEARSL